jgi:hypothetical protein
MPNNIAVSVTVDVADLQVKRAIMSAELKTAQKDLNDFAKTAQSSGMTDGLRTSMLSAADSVARTKAQINALDRELKSAVPAVEAMVPALQSTMHGSAGVTRELLVMGRELGAGNFHRMAGSATILAGRLNILTPEIIGVAVATAALGIPLLAMSGYFDRMFDKQGQAVEKLKEQAKATHDARQAQEQFELTTEGVTAAIEEQKIALGKSAEALKTEAELSYQTAQANLHHEMTIRKVTEALLEQANAEYKSAQAQTFGAGGGAGAGMTTAMYANQVSTRQKQLKDSEASIAQAQKNLEAAQANLSVETGRRMADPVEQVRKKYEGSGGLIDMARQRAVHEHQTGVELQRQVTALVEQEKAEEKAAKPAKGREAKGPKGPGMVAQWTEELRAKEIASNNFYTDETENELKFWQSKLALTAVGSKEQIEIRSKIYESSRALAGEQYQNEIADLNEKIAADRESWAREQADYQNKLAYIRSTYGEMSREYKNALREMERAQQEHDAKEIRETETTLKREADERKRSVDMLAKAREDDARAAEDITRASGGNSPLGDIAVERQMAKIHADLAQQQIADNDRLYAQQSAALNTAIASAVARYGDEKTHYQALLDAKAEADQAYADKKQELDARMRMTSIQDTLAMQQAYHGYIDGAVGTTVSGFSQMIAGQRTFAQVGIAVYGAIVQQVEQQVARMVGNWIVKHLLMSAAQKAQLAVQTGAQAAAATAQVGITVASTKAQVAALVGLAGAGGVASMAAAPFPIDLGAPAFGAAMAASATALGSFAQGTNMVPNDMVAQIHAGERIIPRADNAALMELTARGAGGGGATGGVNHYHTHYSPTINGQTPFADQLAQHEDTMITMLQRAARRGIRFA